MSPFITLPKPPTLPHNYATLPSTLPPSTLSSPPTNSTSPDSDAQPPAYVTSASGFRAHPSTIVAQNRALRDQLINSAADARNTFDAWLDGIKERELAEKRRKAPGWLDSNEKMLRPERAGESKDTAAASEPAGSLLDDRVTPPRTREDDADVNDLGAQMDRAFG